MRFTFLATITQVVGLSLAGSPNVAQTQFSPSKIPSNAAFERIKGLAGEWEAPYRGKIMKDTFRVVGDGSAVLHTESFDGDPSGAVTLIYPVGDELRADHYCVSTRKTS